MLGIDTGTIGTVGTSTAVAEIDLQKLGIPYVGPFKGVIHIPANHIPAARTIDCGKAIKTNIQQITVQRGTRISTRRFVLNKSIYKGNHGLVESVNVYEKWYDNEKKGYTSDIVFRKVPIDGNSLACEAFFQYAAHKVLKAHGLGRTVARVRDIYRDPRIGNAAVFTMEPFIDVDLFSDVLATICLTVETIISILAQIALLLTILDERLDMNHRDLKTSNILLSKVTAADGVALRATNWKGRDITIYGDYSVKLVDFGFACSGTGTRTIVNATEFFPITDPCPKTGRDMFQLLTTIYLCENFRITCGLQEPLRALFANWLAIPGSDYLSFLHKMGEESLDWVYLLLGSDKFRAPKCESAAIFADIMSIFPQVIVYS
jgi:serine/threonine protein kinase